MPAVADLAARFAPLSEIAAALVLLAAARPIAAQEPAPVTPPPPPCSPGGPLLINVPSPDWRDQIIYFAFTDRFADGDPANNDQGAGEYDPSREHYFSGGDIRGVAEHLDYIAGLGATAVWLTPVVLNQWKSHGSDFTGYSGYYGIDFSAVDPHFGTHQDYRALSSALHCRDMYLIKDIVVNHTGNFFAYDGPYDPADTSRGFRLVQPPGARQPAPLQPPFDMIDRNNPAHAAAGIYNWTPTITDYRDLGERQFTWQLGGLADINTGNPRVIDAFKRTYGDWIEKAGVDALRIDTVRYVEPGFFSRFVTDPDGIRARAAATGRRNFLIFGEVLDYSQPYENSGEQELARYLDRPGQPILPSVISFPLKQEIKSVFAQGQPAAQLAYRLGQHMATFPDPFIIPTIVDNHDVARFLASGSVDGFKQAFGLIFTVPGIPTIYQGSEQGFTETRQAMFAGGFRAKSDHYDTGTELYRYLAALAALRKKHPALRRGSFEVLGANQHESGLLAYRRREGAEVLDILFNTSDQPILVDRLSLPGLAQRGLEPVFVMNFDGTLDVPDGNLTAILPPRALLVIDSSRQAAGRASAQAPLDLRLTSPAISQPLRKSFGLAGAVAGAGEVLLVKNGKLGDAIRVMAGPDGRWQFDYPVENLGAEAFFLVAYDPATNRVSQRLELTSEVTRPQLAASLADPRGDDRGPAGTYVDLLQPNAKDQKDITGVQVAAGGDILRLELTMAQVTTGWIPPVGFDNVALSIFFDLPERTGAMALPQLNATMAQRRDWDIGNVVFGWGNTMFSAEGANAERAGKRFAGAPAVSVDRERGTITLVYDGSDFGVRSWHGAGIYVTTWDIAGEGAYVTLGPDPAEWSFGGGAAGGPKILDDALILLGGCGGDEAAVPRRTRHARPDGGQPQGDKAPPMIAPDRQCQSQ